jgi:IS1 family transposase
VKDIEATSVQMDERYGYVSSEKEPLWEATAIEPKGRLSISFVVGRRDEALIEEPMESTKKGLNSPRNPVVMTS